jgi:hypothetical protein
MQAGPKVGDRVESTAGGNTFGRFGIVKAVTETAIDIQWDGNQMYTGYPIHGRVASGLRHHDAANTTLVAQAISRAIDDFQERDHLYLDDGPGMEGTTTRVVEVSAELQNSSNGMTSIFQVKTSDGQTWDVRVTPGRN